jgi:hypothetical protein
VNTHKKKKKSNQKKSDSVTRMKKFGIDFFYIFQIGVHLSSKANMSEKARYFFNAIDEDHNQRISRLVVIVIILFGFVWFGLVWFGLVWFGLVWFGFVWFGLVWFGFCLRSSQRCIEFNHNLISVFFFFFCRIELN